MNLAEVSASSARLDGATAVQGPWLVAHLLSQSVVHNNEVQSIQRESSWNVAVDALGSRNGD